MRTIELQPGVLTRPVLNPPSSVPAADPKAKTVKIDGNLSDANQRGAGAASLYFVGTATTILNWNGVRILTDPNFLHAGDHVHLGPGVVGTRRTNPAVEMDELPPVDLVLLSHYHADHFDQDVEQRLRRDVPIITTPHAKDHLQEPGAEKGEAGAYTELTALDHWQSALINVKGDSKQALKVTAMPGKHVPPGPANIAGKLNDLIGAVPPTNGWMLELGTITGSQDFTCNYRIYITGDTLLIDDLKDIPARYSNAGEPIDLMLMHLGGTTIPSPSVPLLMVTMDAKQGVDLLKLVDPKKALPIHYDDYDVFLSSLDEFKGKVKEAGLEQKLEYLDRGEEYRFKVR